PRQVHLDAQGLDAAQALLQCLPRLQPAAARSHGSLAVQEFPDHGRRLSPLRPDPLPGGFLAMDQSTLQQLAKTYGTPLVVVDHSVLRQNSLRFREHMPRVQVYFAVKANSDPQIVKTFYDAGSSFDVASM